MKTATHLGIALACVAALAACKGDKAANAAMPSGYQEVDRAFGIRAGGVVTEAGLSQAPVVEFRKGGSYALYPLFTDCKGGIRRGSGTLFAKDGTIEDQLAGEAGLSIATHPQYKAVVDRICASAADARALADPFSPRKAMEMLYGPLDNAGEAAWKTTIDGDALDLRVSVRSAGEFSEGRARKQFLVIGSRNPGCDVHACGAGIVGAASFVFDKGRWLLESHEPNLAATGQYGAAPSSGGIRNLAGQGQPPLLLVDGGCFGNGGYCETSGVILSRDGQRFHRAWEGTLSNDDSGSSRCLDTGECTKWEAGFEFKPGSGAQPGTLLMKRTGQAWDQDVGGLSDLDETIRFQLNPATGELRESAREGGATPRVDQPSSAGMTAVDAAAESASADAASMVNRTRAARAAAQAAAEAARPNRTRAHAARARSAADAAAEAAAEAAAAAAEEASR